VERQEDGARRHTLANPGLRPDLALPTGSASELP
jgi:hypothetical protein